MLFNVNKEIVKNDSQQFVVQSEIYGEDDPFAWKKEVCTQISNEPLTQADLDPFFEHGSNEQSCELQYVRDLNFDPTIRASAKDGLASLYRWNGSFWERLSDYECHSKAIKWLIKFVPKKASARNASSLHSTAVISVKHLPSTPNESIVPLQDCWLVVSKSGEFYAMQPDPKWGVTYNIKACLGLTGTEKNYTPAPLPIDSYFSKFLASSLPDAQERNLVQEYCGYTLLNDVRFQVCQFWVGNGCNGKSVLLKIIEQLHAKVGSIRLDTLSGFGLAPAVDASLLISSEAPRRGIDEQAFKQLVSGDPITIEYKFKDMFMYSPRAKLLVACNTFPSFSDSTNGVWRRIQIIQWGVNLAKAQQIPNLEQLIIDNELKIVVDWCLEGLARLLKRGEFSEPKSIANRKKSARTNSNTVMGFVEDCSLAVSVSADFITNDKVYQKYSEYCLTNGLRAYGSPMFWEQMKGLFPTMVKKRITVKTGVRAYATNLAFGEDVQAATALNDNPFNEQ